MRLSKEASLALGTRAAALCRIQIGELETIAAFEPDGEGSHWTLWTEHGENLEIAIELERTNAWPEPRIPNEIEAVLIGDAKITWDSLTPAARWDWVRWALAAKQAETRQKRINSIPSRLASGKRRPCCFDRTQCTLTDA